MFNPFAVISLVICLYEIVSLILPLKISIYAKILCALILLSGLIKTMLYFRTPTGFDIYELSYSTTLIISAIYNFMIVVFFMLVLKDFAWLLCKLLLRKTFPYSHASTFVLVLGVVATIYGTYQGIKLPEVRTHEIFINGLHEDLDGFRIAMLVDIHASTLNNRSFVKSIVDRTNSLSPDVILIPGDFVDGHVINRYSDVEPLKDLKAANGVYGTSGNHEYYFDFNGWMSTLKNFHVNILENEHVIITSGDGKLIIAGIPDPTGGRMGLVAPDIAHALENAPENLPVILMHHQPQFARDNAKYNISLQISGHTHGGQMPGIDLLVKKFNNGFLRGFYDVDGMQLYVSPGSSQWNGLPLRIFDPSEITLFILRAR